MNINMKIGDIYINMLNKGLEYTQNKDRRISWLSVFSSLCQKEREASPEDLQELGFKLVDELYKKYPLPVEDMEYLNEPRPILKKHKIGEKFDKTTSAPF